MAVQNCIGDAARGATWVALHNGGGTGWGEAMNGGFGLVLDGSDEAAEKSRQVLSWDVSNGVARRCWSGKSEKPFLKMGCTSIRIFPIVP
jgi:urocanate hydratase